MLFQSCGGSKRQIKKNHGQQESKRMNLFRNSRFVAALLCSRSICMYVHLYSYARGRTGFLKSGDVPPGICQQVLTTQARNKFKVALT